MKTKHTPGPWRIAEEEFNTGNMYIISGKEYLQLATIHQRIVKEETESNANLIAAAPELLEACKEALAVLDELNEKEEGPFAMPIPLMEKLREVIEKAEGRP